ncbi:MAG: LolA-related protein [Janthinobacterium lividum]
MRILAARCGMPQHPGWRAMALATLMVLLPAGPAASAAAVDWNMDQLMAALAKNTHSRATFVETKTMAMLERPVESSGELMYSAPDQLVKRTIKPVAETMSASGDTLRLERGSLRHTLRMADYPELAGFIASIRGTLAGDRRALEQSFTMTIEGPADHWLLTLKPIQARLGRNVHLIRIEGVRENVSSIEIIQSDGDRTIMAITPVAAR